uniref:Uncharacterized protein n=1 Tax=viral metagenome TaxID=1070528 RepID=A0A6C0C258_9ZZZZ
MNKLYVIGIWLFINFFFLVIPYFYPTVASSVLLSYQCWFNAVIVLILFLPGSSALYLN